jgi:alginate O-acetyltransferase complex protein AlgI
MGNPIILFFTIEWIGKKSKFAIEKILSNQKTILRWSFYSFLIFLIGMYADTNETPFIYFQF